MVGKLFDEQPGLLGRPLSLRMIRVEEIHLEHLRGALFDDLLDRFYGMKRFG